VKTTECENAGPRCHGCRHFLVTHDTARPYACRAFGIKSRRLPSDEVRDASGWPCAACEPRPALPEGRLQPVGRATRRSRSKGGGLLA
jgi:hypothetical protein